MHSINSVYAQLVLQVGPDKAAALAHAAGITSDLPVEPSITLGAGDVSPLELADAYLTFARDGERVEPFAIAKVQAPDGHTMYDASPKTSPAMKPDTAHLVDFVLQQVIDRGTGTGAKLDRPVAGKTGTTENNADAWFAGYTPDYAAVVWMGYPESNSPAHGQCPRHHGHRRNIASADLAPVHGSRAVGCPARQVPRPTARVARAARRSSRPHGHTRER